MFQNSYCLTLENFSKLFISYPSLTNIQFSFLVSDKNGKVDGRQVNPK